LHEKATHVRHLVLAYLCVLSFILYLDRACIGQAAPRIKDDLGLTQTQLGHAQAAFTLG
jgi:ACS family glucarate transporter-like MFS transporter